MCLRCVSCVFWLASNFGFVRLLTLRKRQSYRFGDLCGEDLP